MKIKELPGKIWVEIKRHPELAKLTVGAGLMLSGLTYLGLSCRDSPEKIPEINQQQQTETRQEENLLYQGTASRFKDKNSDGMPDFPESVIKVPVEYYESPSRNMMTAKVGNDTYFLIDSKKKKNLDLSENQGDYRNVRLEEIHIKQPYETRIYSDKEIGRGTKGKEVKKLFIHWEDFYRKQMSGMEKELEQIRDNIAEIDPRQR